jgi:hypothetical protein
LICIKNDSAEAINLTTSDQQRCGGTGHWALLCDTRIQVRFRRMRYLSLFFAVMFFANNAGAAVCAFAADWAVQGRVAAHASAASADEPACPQCEEEGSCLTHFVQSFHNDEQNIWVGVSPVALVPILNVREVRVPAQPKLVVPASAPPIVGPSLAILYRNFRK